MRFHAFFPGKGYSAFLLQVEQTRINFRVLALVRQLVVEDASVRSRAPRHLRVRDAQREPTIVQNVNSNAKFAGP